MQLLVAKNEVARGTQKPTMVDGQPPPKLHSAPAQEQNQMDQAVRGSVAQEKIVEGSAAATAAVGQWPTAAVGPQQRLGIGPPPPLARSGAYTHLRAHETKANLVVRLLLEKKKKNN